jgi:alpha-glucosidase
MAYCFEFLAEDFNFLQTDTIVEDFFTNNPASWPCWSYSNHDSMRIASRIKFNPKEIMQKLLSLKGNICIYQGEELGLEETDVEFKDLQDPFGKNFWPDFKGRDGCRTPMPWDSKKSNLGFSPNNPWLPMNQLYLSKCVDLQVQDKESMLSFTKELLRKRKKGIAT